MAKDVIAKYTGHTYRRRQGPILLQPRIDMDNAPSLTDISDSKLCCTSSRSHESKEPHGSGMEEDVLPVMVNNSDESFTASLARRPPDALSTIVYLYPGWYKRLRTVQDWTRPVCCVVSFRHQRIALSEDLTVTRTSTSSDISHMSHRSSSSQSTTASSGEFRPARVDRTPQLTAIIFGQ